MIDRYLAELRRGLRGPVLLRWSMLRELRDGLRDAAQAHRGAGASAADAERLAVRECGPVQVVAAALREELAASVARYLVVLFLAFGAIEVAIGQFVWGSAVVEQEGWQPPGAAYGTFAFAVDVMHVVLVFAAAAALFALGRGGRVLATRRVVRIAAIGVLASVAVDLVAGGLLSALAPNDPATWKGPELMLMGALGAVSALWCAWLAWRCLWLTSRRRSGSQHLADDAAELPPVLLPRG